MGYMIAQFLAPVVGVEPVAPNHFVLTCHAPELAEQARPGCFVNVKAEGEGYDPLLRKPFSIYAADPETGLVKMLFSVVGATTRTMARKLPGDTVDMVGPLGGSLFTPDARPNVHHICVGGGYGVPPLVFLSHQLKAARQDVTFLIGARTKDLLLCERELQDAGFRTLTATDDGSCGFQGLVTDRLAELLDGQAPPAPQVWGEDVLQSGVRSTIPKGQAQSKENSLALSPPKLGGPGGPPFCVYCCGPTPMMRAVAQLCLERRVPCQVSMEVAMPCGIGVCMGCVLDLADGRRVRCCTDGPVFGAEAIQW